MMLIESVLVNLKETIFRLNVCQENMEMIRIIKKAAGFLTYQFLDRANAFRIFI